MKLSCAFAGFVEEVAKSRNITVNAVEDAIEEGYVAMEDYQKAGLFTGLKYKYPFAVRRSCVIDIIRQR